MYKKATPVLLVTMLSACSVSSPEAYQRDVSPENRQEYNGVEGMAQYQKDQSYLMTKELADKCTTAEIDLVIAQAEKNAQEIKRQNEVIKNTCV